MTWQPLYSLIVVGLVMLVLIATSLPADVAMVLGLLAIIAPGVITPDWQILSTKDVLQGFGNESVAVIGILFIIAGGVRETGAVAWLSERVLGRAKSVHQAVARVSFTTAIISAFTNNTPLVAMMIPAIHDWAKKNQISASKLMIPLSYAAILGGTCTLIGTSTNFVVYGNLKERGLDMGMFDVSWVGIPVALVGCAFLILVGPRLLPERKPVLGDIKDAREYVVEMLVPNDSPLAGKTIEDAGLRHLPGLYLAEIERQGVLLPAVSPREQLLAHDRLVFVGIVDSVVELQKTRGLLPATNQVFKLDSHRNDRCLIEAVVSDSCPLVGKSIRDGRFRSNYQAVVIAVARNGERIQGKIGDIVLQPGDTLLVEAHESFVDRQRHSRDFFLVSRLEDSAPPRHERAPLSLAIVGAMIAVVATNVVELFPAALIAAGLMLATRCCSIDAARRAIDWQILIVVAASFGVALAVEKTGASRQVAEGLVGFAGGNPHVALALLYIVTLVTTELISNAAAAALMFPFAMDTAQRMGVSHMPFVLGVMIAASAAFATPIGYQTNLMVMGPGGYKFSDYVKVGLPLDIISAIVAIALLPWAWPFAPLAKP